MNGTVLPAYLRADLSPRYAPAMSRADKMTAEGRKAELLAAIAQATVTATHDDCPSGLYPDKRGDIDGKALEAAQATFPRLTFHIGGATYKVWHARIPLQAFAKAVGRMALYAFAEPTAKTEPAPVKALAKIPEFPRVIRREKIAPVRKESPSTMQTIGNVTVQHQTGKTVITIDHAIVAETAKCISLGRAKFEKIAIGDAQGWLNLDLLITRDSFPALGLGGEITATVPAGNVTPMKRRAAK